MSKIPINAERLREILANDERHLSALEESIEKQQCFIQHLRSEWPGDSTAIETARALLATMNRARAGYIAERERIWGLLTD